MANKRKACIHLLNEIPLYWYNYASFQNVQECYIIDCNKKN